MSGKPQPLFPRLFPKLVDGDEWNQMGPHWLWTGVKDRHGYGYVNYEGRRWSTHRLVYTLMVGPIPEGLELDHECRTPACASPNHLEPVTHQENLRRGYWGAKTHCPRGHEYNEANTYVKPSDGSRSCRVCKRERDQRRAAVA